MGHNWPDYLKEAHRVLQPFGLLFVAEPQKQRWDEGKLEQAIKDAGFSVMQAYVRSGFRYVVAAKT
jgi:ubiquinone/menaquinone biosynthesis C-methylase UbiE